LQTVASSSHIMNASKKLAKGRARNKQQLLKSALTFVLIEDSTTYEDDSKKVHSIGFCTWRSRDRNW
jgi:hypothetical protein